MSQFYNLLSFQATGEPWSNQYGTFQTYWAEFEGLDKSAMLSKKQGSTPALGATYGDMVMATSQNGNQYYKFKSAQKPQGVVAPQFGTQPQVAQQSQPMQAQQQAQQQPARVVGDTAPGWFMPYGNMIKYIFDETKRMAEMGGENDQPGGVTVAPNSAPVSPEQEAELNSIFNSEPPITEQQ